MQKGPLCPESLLCHPLSWYDTDSLDFFLLKKKIIFIFYLFILFIIFKVGVMPKEGRARPAEHTILEQVKSCMMLLM